MTRSDVIGGAAEPIELHIDEAHVEVRVVNHELAVIADEVQEIVDDGRELRLVGEERRRDAVDALGVGVHVATVRIDEAVKLLAGRDAVQQLDAADLDQAVAIAGIKARRLGVEHDLAQHASAPLLQVND